MIVVDSLPGLSEGMRTPRKRRNSGVRASRRGDARHHQRALGALSGLLSPPRSRLTFWWSGPAGSATATHLAHRGLHVALLDKAQFLGKRCAATA